MGHDRETENINNIIYVSKLETPRVAVSLFCEKCFLNRFPTLESRNYPICILYLKREVKMNILDKVVD